MDKLDRDVIESLSEPIKRLFQSLDHNSQRRVLKQNDSNLSAAQIEQLRLAAQAGVPENEVLKMAKGKKEPMEIRRCVEFFQMVRQTRGKGGFFTPK